MSETRKIPVGRQVDTMTCPQCRRKFHVDDYGSLNPDVTLIRYCPFCGIQALPGRTLSMVEGAMVYAELAVETRLCSECARRSSVQLHDVPGKRVQALVFIPPEQLDGCPWCHANW